MKIKLEDYSLISNEWIDERIKNLTIIREKLIQQDMSYNATQNRIDELLSLKEQLIPSEKLARMSWEDGHYIGTHFVDNKTSELHKEHFLTS